MPDYGHELAFGTFITPLNRSPEAVVALAELTERVGLEYATFQDHPYQPAFLDTWTLMAWVAAQTETLRVAPNVLNLPLRPPAVLARAAASLDLLSNGRVELGLGAGAFWDGIEAMGGRRLTPGQGVDALSEAIDVIRGVWAVSERGGVRVDGEHHRVRGAKRGPAPAHDISLWLGAYKPRMLRLTGRKADGWLPSLMFMSPEALGPANRAIDDAAVAAGRDPAGDPPPRQRAGGRSKRRRADSFRVRPPSGWSTSSRSSPSTASARSSSRATTRRRSNGSAKRSLPGCAQPSRRNAALTSRAPSPRCRSRSPAGPGSSCAGSRAPRAGGRA